MQIWKTIKQNKWTVNRMRLSIGQKVINGQNPLKRVWKNEAFDENCLDLSDKFKRLLYRRTDDNLLPDESIRIDEKVDIQIDHHGLKQGQHFGWLFFLFLALVKQLIPL